MKNRILLQRIGYTVAGLACITFALDWRAGLAAFGAMLILRRMLITLGAHLGGFALTHFGPNRLQGNASENLERRERPIIVERPGKVERPAKPPREDPPAAPPQPPEEKKRHGAGIDQELADLAAVNTIEIPLVRPCPRCGKEHHDLRADPEPPEKLPEWLKGATHHCSCPTLGRPGFWVSCIAGQPLAIRSDPRPEGYWRAPVWPSGVEVFTTSPPDEALRRAFHQASIDMDRGEDWPAAGAGEEKGGPPSVTLREDLEPLREEITSFPAAPPDADAAFPLDGPPKA